MDIGNAMHQDTNKALGTKSYFATLYHSWGKDQVEYAIRVFRRYFPKKTNFYTIKGTDISVIPHSINNLPRKCLGFLTPCEAFAVAFSH